ncbi:MAG: MATE family efflux transporter [Verrucomicrobia bacterium]|nr:MAG: MATE family efflux transporter [Verrucomicrobiota bacterium]
MSLLTESRETLKLAIPLMIGQLSQMLMGVVDTLMVGQIGVTELAALTFTNALFHVPLVFGIGLLSGISVFTANARGAGNPEAARASCRHGLYLSVSLGLVVVVISIFLANHLSWFGQPQEVVDRSRTFFLLIMISALPALASLALKNHADALQRPWPPFWIFLGGVALNVLLNWIMIYGKWGMPALGLEGAAWATLIARIAVFVAMMIWLIGTPDLREWVPYRWLRMPIMKEIKRLLSIGAPASILMTCEVLAFSLAGLMMGRFGAVSMAAHQIAITLAATAFMLPLGLSMALMVRVGQVDGAQETRRIRPIVVSGWILCGLASLLSASLFLGFGATISSWFVDDMAVIAITSKLLVIVGIFQIFDSLQVCSSGMLRGLKDARVPALMGFVAYWIVGLPVAAVFAFQMKLDAIGVWWGLAAGLAVACLTLGARLWKKTQHAHST